MSDALKVAVAAACAVVLGLGIWGASVVLAPLFGKGNAYKIKESAGNRIVAQKGFHQRYQDILATDRKLDSLSDLAKSGDRTAVQNLVGVKSYCQSAVAGYNTDARAYTSQDFRDVDLPQEIDLSDPRTDCKETGK